MSIETERSLNELLERKKFLKYYTNGVCGHPVLYVCGRDQVTPQTTVTTMPTIISSSDFGKWRYLREHLENNKQRIINLKHERFRLFSIDNFLCVLLLYGSPKICDAVLNNDAMKNIVDYFNLLRLRRRLINCVKLDRDCEDIDQPSNEASQQISAERFSSINSLIMLIPTLRSSLYLKRLKKFVERKNNLFSGLKDIRLIHTKESSEDANVLEQAIKNIVRDSFRIEKEEVDVKKMVAKTKELVNVLPKEVLVVCIGEIPKIQLVELVQISDIRLGVVIWRPLISSNEEIRRLLEKIFEESSLQSIENLELCLLEV